VTTIIIGNATKNATPHAFTQIRTKLLTSPMLKAVTTKDIRPDMSSAIKNANTIGWYFLGNNLD
jgi:hypothetical protein